MLFEVNKVYTFKVIGVRVINGKSYYHLDANGTSIIIPMLQYQLQYIGTKYFPTQLKCCYLGVDRDGNTYGLDKNGNYAIAIAGVTETGHRAIVRYGVNQVGYPKFVAMMFAAYIEGTYYSLKGDIPAFNGLAELSPTSSAKAVRYSVGKNLLPTATPQLTLGNKIESAEF